VQRSAACGCAPMARWRAAADGDGSMNGSGCARVSRCLAFIERPVLPSAVAASPARAAPVGWHRPTLDIAEPTWASATSLDRCRQRRPSAGWVCRRRRSWEPRSIGPVVRQGALRRGACLRWVCAATSATQAPQGGTRAPRPAKRNLSVREIYATAMGVLGTVLAITSVLPLDVLGAVLLCVAEVAMLVGLFLHLPATPQHSSSIKFGYVATATSAAFALPFAAVRVFPAPHPYASVPYNLYNGIDVREGLKVRRARGHCWIGSIVDWSRNDAWRCMKGHNIQDPCFESPSVREEVVCSRDPWTSEVLVLDLTEPLPRQYANELSVMTGHP